MDRVDETEAVEDAWQQTFSPGAGFDPDQALEDCGADSLKVLQFVLRLEMALGRSVPFDLIGAHVTARSLSAALRGATGGKRGDPPSIFFFGGIGGDEPMLGAIRRGLSDVASFTFVDAPGLELPAATLTDLVRTAEVAADDLARRQSDGPVRLMGYSFGGLLAFEVALALDRRGRRVELLYLLDPIPVRGGWRWISDLARSPSSWKRKLRSRLPRFSRSKRQGASGSLMVDLALRFGAYRLASRAAVPKSSGDTGESDRYRLQGLRSQAVRVWRPRMQDVPTWLVMSEDGRIARTDRYWGALTRTLTVLPVPKSHFALADADAVAAIRAGVVDALSRR